MKKLHPITQIEAETLEIYLQRAIANGQLALRVASLLLPGDPDEFGDGDRHDGHETSSDAWAVEATWGHAVDPDADNHEGELRPEIKISVDDKSLCFLAGVTQEEAEQAFSNRHAAKA